ncbi:MAG: hypothetical protein RMJ98_22420 [Myxococcales bacterium]|nr:Uma2 family endonuclease [Polyangiaceae bacterium]MDW8252059.1 hypothetical protein [Myxococcales bacterium]
MSVQSALPEGPTPRRPATLEDWEAVPAPYTGHLINGRLYVHPKPPTGPNAPGSVKTLINGRLYVHPKPLPHHAWALGHLHDQLGPCNRLRGGPAPGGWLLLREDVRLGRSIVAPDLARWRREKMPTLPDETPVVLVPDGVCAAV